MIYFGNIIKINFLTDCLWRVKENGLKKKTQFSAAKLVVFNKIVKLEN